MAKYKLNDIAPIKQGVVLAEDKYWLLNLDMVESNTGKIIDYLYVPKEEIGASTVTFDTDNVLYSKLRPYLNKVVLPDRPGYATSEMLPMRPNIDIITREYLTYFLRSPHFVSYINEKTSGAKMPRANSSDLKAVEIECPTINEQKRITAIFDEVISIIQLRQKELSKLNNLIKARFVEMFDSIKDICEVGYYIKSLTAGKSLAGEAECENKVLKTGAASFDFFDATQVKNLPVDYEPKEEHLVNVGDIIISRMNTAELTGAAAYVWDVPGKVYLPDRLWKAVLDDNSNPIFVWQMLIQPSTKEQIQRECSGTSGSMKNISKAGMLGIKVKKVPLEMQDQFADFVKQVDKSKVAIQAALDKSQLLFDSLMQKYFG